MKSRDGKSQREEKSRREKIRRERVRRKKMQMCEKVGKSRNTVFFRWFVAPEGRKGGSLKRRVRSHLSRWEMKKCTLLRRKAHFEVKTYKTHHARTTFGSWDVEKVHAVVARSTFRSQHVQDTPFLEVEMSKKCTLLRRKAHFEVKTYKTHHARTTFGSWDVEKVHTVAAQSTFRSQNVQNKPFSDHFWKLRCRKSARCCGAKHISKSTCTRHTIFGPLLEVEMSKKCTLLRRKAHFEVKTYKTHHARTTFGSWDVEKVHAVVARSTFRSQHVQDTPFSDHFWKLRCRKSAHCCGAKHVSKSKRTKHTMLGPLLEVEMSKKCTLLWREAHFEVNMYKTHHFRTTFASWDVEKVHTVAAQSTFRSQNVQNTPCSDHFWKLRCRKSAHCCGAKHISKSKRTKHTMLGPLLEVEMSKKCTLLRRKAHFEVNVKSTRGSDRFLTFRCRFAWQAQGIAHLLKSEQNGKALWHFQKRWQAWDMWRGSAKMHVAWQAQYKRHVHQRC